MGELKTANTESLQLSDAAPAAAPAGGGGGGVRAAVVDLGGGGGGGGARDVVRVGVDDVEEVVRDLVEVRHRAHAERDDVALALEHADVAVHAHVLAHRHDLLRALRVVRVDPLLDGDRAGAVVDDVLLGGGGVARLDDLAEEGQVVHLLAVHLEDVILREAFETVGGGVRFGGGARARRSDSNAVAGAKILSISHSIARRRGGFENQPRREGTRSDARAAWAGGIARARRTALVALTAASICFTVRGTSDSARL